MDATHWFAIEMDVLVLIAWIIGVASWMQEVAISYRQGKCIYITVDTCGHCVAS